MARVYGYRRYDGGKRYQDSANTMLRKGGAEKSLNDPLYGTIESSAEEVIETATAPAAVEVEEAKPVFETAPEAEAVEETEEAEQNDETGDLPNFMTGFMATDALAQAQAVEATEQSSDTDDDE